MPSVHVHLRAALPQTQQARIENCKSIDLHAESSISIRSSNCHSLCSVIANLFRISLKRRGGEDEGANTLMLESMLCKEFNIVQSQWMQSSGAFSRNLTRCKQRLARKDGFASRSPVQQSEDQTSAWGYQSRPT